MQLHSGVFVVCGSLAKLSLSVFIHHSPLKVMVYKCSKMLLLYFKLNTVTATQLVLFINKKN